MTEKPKCDEPINVELQGKRYMVVDPDNPCRSLLTVFAKYSGREVVSPKEYEALQRAEGKTETTIRVEPTVERGED